MKVSCWSNGARFTQSFLGPRDDILEERCWWVWQTGLTLMLLLSGFTKFWDSLFSPSLTVFLGLQRGWQIREEMSEQILSQKIWLRCGCGIISVPSVTCVISNILAGSCGCNWLQTSYPERRCLPPRETWQPAAGAETPRVPVSSLPISCLGDASTPSLVQTLWTLSCLPSETTTCFILSDTSSAAHAVLQCSRSTASPTTNASQGRVWSLLSQFSTGLLIGK